MALKENYKDDILDTSQNVKRKYQMENNGDGTVSFTDVTEYTQQGDSFGASDMNATNGKVNALETDIDDINDNLSGFKFYPTGTELVALVADDSFYTDDNGKYVLADSPTGQTLLADTATYKALASTEDCRGEAGADSAVPFSKEENPEITLNYSISLAQGGTANLPNLITDFDSYISEMDIGNPNYANGQLRIVVMENNNFNIGYSYQNGGSMSIPTKVKIKKMEKGLSENEVTRQFSVPGSYTISSGFNQLYGIKKLTFAKGQGGWTTFYRVRIEGNDLILNCAHPYSSAENVTVNIVFVGK